MNFEEIMNKFTEHPETSGMSYGEHLKHASISGFRSIGAGLVLITHGLFPMLFEKIGSEMIKDINQELNEKKEK